MEMSVEGKTKQAVTIVGVDLGGGKGKKTAVALLEGDDNGAAVRFVGTRTPTEEPFYDEQLLDYLAQFEPERTVVAVNAPLTLPVCVRCRLPQCPGQARCIDSAVAWFRERAPSFIFSATAGISGRATSVKPVTTPYTQRLCEIVLYRQYGILPRETMGQGMGPLTARAHYLRRAIEQNYTLNENLIEVYPKATIHQLFGAEAARCYKRKVDTWKTRAEIFEGLSANLRFEVWREGCLSNDHYFDAVMCAYTGFLWALKQWEIPPAFREIAQTDGWIWFPPKGAEEPGGG